MINQGFNPLEEMSRKTGKTIGQLKDEMSKGAISAKMVQDAFMSATQEGGKFFGMSEAGADTIAGQMSMLGDAWGSVMNEVGGWTEEFAKGALSVSTTLVDNWQKLIPIILGVAAAYGASKVAELMAITAEEQLAAAKAKNIGVTITSTTAETARGTAMSFATLKTMVATKAHAAWNATLAACPYVAIAAGIAALGYVVYSYAVEGREFEKAQGAMNDRMAEAEVQTKKDTAELKFLCDEYRKASDAVNGLNNAQENGSDNTERLENQTQATEGLTGATRQETEAERQRTGAVREGSQTTDEATQTTEGHTGAVETETGALEDNTDANETNEEKQKKLNTTKGELIALANKYKVELDEEQLRIENLASTYDTLAKRISDVNKAKAVMSIRDEAQAQMDAAVSTGASQINSTFAKKVRTDDKTKEELVKAISVQSEGTQAYTAIMDAIKSGALQLDSKDFSGLTNDLSDQLKNGNGIRDANFKDIMAKITAAVGEEQATSFKDMIDLVEDSSWYEGEFHDFSEQLFTAMRDASAYQRNMAATDKIAEELKPTIDELNKKEEKEEVKHNLSEIVKRIKEAQGEITKLREKMKSGDFTDEDIKQLEEWQKKEDAAKKEYKQATGKDYGSQTKDSAKKLKEAELNLEKELYNLRKQEQNMEKQALQYQMGKTESLIEQKDLQDKILAIEREQAIEDLKRQEAEKLRQIKERKDLNAKDKETLTRKTKELYEGKEGATGAEGVGMIGMKEREFNAKASQQNIEFLKKQQDQLKELLGTYGDHYDKRQAILEKYEKERKKFLESGGSEDSVEYKNFEKARKKELTDLDKSETFDETEWKDAMAVEKEINTIVEGAVKEGSEAMLSALHGYITSAEGELATLEDGITKAKASGDNGKVLELEAKREKLQKSINKAKESETELQKDIAKNGGKATKQIERQNKKFETTKKVVGMVSDALEVMGDIVDENTKKWLDMVSVIADSTMSVINGIQTFAEATTEAMEESSKGAAESVKTVEKASAVLAIIGAVIQAATKIASMFSKDRTTGELVSQWRDVAGIYSEMASTQADIAGNARTAELAAEATNKQTEALKKQAEAEREALKARAANRDKHSHSTGYKENEKLQGADWQAAFSAAGVSVKNWEDLMNLAPEKLKEIRENNAFLWSSLDGDMRQSLENLISIDEQGKQASENLADRFANITLDNLKDSAAEVFSDMDAQSSAFTDNLQSALRDAIIQSTVENEYGKELEKLKSNMTDMGKDGVSPEEAARIMQEGKELQERINARKLELANEYGESGLFNSESTDDNTVTTGTFAEMSEATANALEGRFTAVYESNLRIESAVTANGGIMGSIATINSSMAEQIAQNARVQAEAGQETQRLLAESLLELKGINENGGNVLKMLKTIASDLAEVRDSTAKL